MTETIKTSLEGLKAFLMYFGASTAMLFVFTKVYMAITPYDELKLVREKKSEAAALTFAGAIAGIAIPLGSVIAHSAGMLDMVIWGSIAMIIQIMTYLGTRLIFPHLTLDISNNNIPKGIVLAAFSVTIGYLNAMCMIY